MSRRTFRGVCILSGGLLGIWLGVRYALPVLLPFLVGSGVALAAEPLVGWLHRRLKLKRWMASGIGVSGAVVLLVGVLVLMVALLVKQAGLLSGALPEVLEGVSQGMDSLEQGLLSLTDAAPRSLRSVLSGAVTGFFSDSSSFLEGLAGKVFGFVTGLLGTLTSGVFGFATAVLSAFMISVRLPRIRKALNRHLPRLWRQKYLPVWKGVRQGVTGWLSAQLKLSVIAFGALLVGFWLLRVPYGILWAAVIAVVDLLPVLGCGTVLVPWSLICLLQGQQLRGLGLLGLYGVVWLLRSVLEPKLLGKELGLDPLVTLLAVYAGYRLLGLTGMLLAPILAVAVVKLAEQGMEIKEKPLKKG